MYTPRLSVASLAFLPGVTHAFSLALAGAEAERAFAAAAAPGCGVVARLRQVHGATVVTASRGETAAGPGTRTGQADAATIAAVVFPVAGARPEGDALVTAERGVALVVATADCVPILLADPVAGVIAAVHAGWRGMRSRIVMRAVEALAAQGAEPGRLRAGIGPAVQGSCYEVGDEVRAEFVAAGFPEAGELFTGRRLDLIAAAVAELKRAGVPAASIRVIDQCTHCRSDLASHRRQGRERGTNLSLIALTR